MITPELNGLSALGASTARQMPSGALEHTLETWFEHQAATKVSAVTVILQGSMEDEGKYGIVNTTGPVLAVGSTAEQFANSAFTYRIDNTNYNKAAVSAGSAFTSAHVVTATKFGVINIYINDAGTFVTYAHRVGDDQTTALGYASAALAIAYADAIKSTVQKDLVYVGRILINANSGNWVANTDDMTDTSDLTTATFISAIPQYTNVSSKTFSAAELAAGKAFFTVNNTYYRYMRLFLSAITGTGNVYGQHYAFNTSRP